MPAEATLVPVGSPAPEFALPGPHGEVRLGDYRGQKAVLLVFLRAFG